MERVSVIEGDSPFMLVCPHGPDDNGSAELTELIANQIDAYAVINRGWEKAPQLDYWKDKANCNDIRHLLSEDVLKEEFLDPILRSVSRIERDWDFTYVFIIHGVGDYVRKISNDPQLDIILGFGAGNPPSYSCDPNFKDAFAYHLCQQQLHVFEGRPGGKFAGKAKNNLNQLFRRWHPNTTVQSIQVEVIRELRQKDVVEVTADAIASCIDALLDLDDASDYLMDLNDI
jgi:hypothetical protein